MYQLKVINYSNIISYYIAKINHGYDAVEHNMWS